MLTVAQCSAIDALLRRYVGAFASNIAYELAADLPAESYRIEYDLPRLRIRAANVSSLTRGLYAALRTVGRFYCGYDGSHFAPADARAVPATEQGASPVALRHYLNVCTFGYTTPWWDWARWEREIDWMAWHGINLPLSLTGQDAIWQCVWRSFELDPVELDAHFPGPAYLPWHWMGGIAGHAGPLPQAWMEGQRALQRKIFEREKLLGMEPVVHGFAGFVSAAFQARHPTAQLTRTSGWSGFAPLYWLDPADPLFSEIFRRYVAHYREAIGTPKYFLIDCFNELQPTFAEHERAERLAEMGGNIAHALQQAAPGAVWVMQGWQFISHRGRQYWTNELIEAFFSQIPPEQLLLLDLATDADEVWLTHEAFRRRNWVHCTLHNFGGATALFGDLPYFNATITRALEAPDHGALRGLGYTPEGIANNAVVAEFLTDRMWSFAAIDPAAWIKDYATRRYGNCPREVARAWQRLLATIYQRRSAFFSRSLMPDYTRRPMLHQPEDLPRRSERRAGENFAADKPSIWPAPQHLLAAAIPLGNQPLFRRDLVECWKQYLAERADCLIPAMRAAFHAADYAAFQTVSTCLLQALDDLDALINTIPELRLQTWLEAARSMAATPVEADRFELNARLQVTGWAFSNQKGPEVDNNLTDYARKEWSGLIAGYYRARWAQLIDRLNNALKSSVPFDEADWVRDMHAWEDAWARSTDPLPSPASGSTDLSILLQKIAIRWSDVV
jgi:alpha-N-acetylglucosaminidase